MVQKFPLDFMSAMRPQTKTTNQTLRMLGTYETDSKLVDKLGARIPAGVTSGFHPDVQC